MSKNNQLEIIIIAAALVLGALAFTPKTKEKPVEYTHPNTVLYFGATWCGPCKMQKPNFKFFAESNPQFNPQYVDVDANPKLSQKFGIRSIPTTVFIKDNKEKHRSTGVLTPEELLEKANQFLKSHETK